MGTKLKIAVTADLGEVHMSEVEFECRFFRIDCADRGVTVPKAGMTYVSQDEYLAVVDTRDIGPGEYFMQFTAQVPDQDIDGGLRQESVTVPTGIRVMA